MRNKHAPTEHSQLVQTESAASLVSDNKWITYIFWIAFRTLLPAEVHQGIIWLIHVYHAFSFIRMNHSTFHIHFSCAEFNKVFALRAAGLASKQCSWRHFVLNMAFVWVVKWSTLQNWLFAFMCNKTHVTFWNFCFWAIFSIYVVVLRKSAKLVESLYFYLQFLYFPFWCTTYRYGNCCYPFSFRYGAIYWITILDSITNLWWKQSNLDIFFSSIASVIHDFRQKVMTGLKYNYNLFHSTQT